MAECPTYGNCPNCYGSGPVGMHCGACPHFKFGVFKYWRDPGLRPLYLDAANVSTAMDNADHMLARVDRMFDWLWVTIPCTQRLGRSSAVGLLEKMTSAAPMIGSRPLSSTQISLASTTRVSCRLITIHHHPSGTVRFAYIYLFVLLFVLWHSHALFCQLRDLHLGKDPRQV